MQDRDYLPVNFTLSRAAQAEIARLRAFWDERVADKADVLVIGWSTIVPNVGPTREAPFVSFYGLSERPDIAHGIQMVADMEVVFFVLEADHGRFADRILDFASARGFFLKPRAAKVRQPRSSSAPRSARESPAR